MKRCELWAVGNELIAHSSLLIALTLNYEKSQNTNHRSGSCGIGDCLSVEESRTHANHH